MTYSTITGERDDTAQHSRWNGTMPSTKWQESSWGKRIAAVAAMLVPVAVAGAMAAAAIVRKRAGEQK